MDYAEIDLGLTYYENKRHLETLIQKPDSFYVKKYEGEIDLIKAAEEEYLRRYALTNYIFYVKEGKNLSTETGSPWQHRFSLKDFIASKI